MHEGMYELSNTIVQENYNVMLSTLNYQCCTTVDYNFTLPPTTE